jgi:hypothetical protein
MPLLRSLIPPVAGECTNMAPMALRMDAPDFPGTCEAGKPRSRGPHELALE